MVQSLWMTRGVLSASQGEEKERVRPNHAWGLLSEWGGLTTQEQGGSLQCCTPNLGEQPLMPGLSQQGPDRATGTTGR